MIYAYSWSIFSSSITCTFTQWRGLLVTY